MQSLYKIEWKFESKNKIEKTTFILCSIIYIYSLISISVLLLKLEQRSRSINMRWNKGKKTLHMGIKTIQTPLFFFFIINWEKWREEKGAPFSMIKSLIYKLSPLAFKVLMVVDFCQKYLHQTLTYMYNIQGKVQYFHGNVTAKLRDTGHTIKDVSSHTAIQGSIFRLTDLHQYYTTPL